MRRFTIQGMMRGGILRLRVGLAGVVAMLWMGGVAAAQQPGDVLRKVLAGTQASAVVLDWDGQRVIASYGARREGLPGSAIKPLLLDYALKHGVVRADTTVYCRRDLHVGARALPCTHPRDRTTFDAETALAESCNTWFAEMGKRFAPEQMELALEETGLRHAPMQRANAEQRQLVALGLEGVTVTPEELARAYGRLLRSGPAPAVLRGLRDSVASGMANEARVAGVDVLGKTGTVADAGSYRTHGWFAGGVPQRFILVVYVPQGNGAGAAALAGRFIAQEMGRR